MWYLMITCLYFMLTCYRTLLIRFSANCTHVKNVCNTNSNKCCRSLRPYINPLYAGSVYIQDTNLVITVPADALAPHGARSSAGTVMATQLDVFSTKCVCLEVMLRYLSWPDDKISRNLTALRVLSCISTLSVGTVKAKPLKLWIEEWLQQGFWQRSQENLLN